MLSSKIEDFKNKRGSSAVFICPFCHFIVDADIQAAFMMAVRGYLRFSGIVPSQSESSENKKQEEKKTTGESFLEKTIEILNKMNRTEIIRSLSPKL